MSEYLRQYVSELSERLNNEREVMRFADKFARSLAESLDKIIGEFTRQPKDFTACPITKIADLKSRTDELDLETWRFRIEISAGISEAIVLVNAGPGIILFEFSRGYTDRTATFRRAAVQFTEAEQAPTPSTGPFPPKVAKQNWTNSSLWLTKGVRTDVAVASEKLATGIIDYLVRFDIAADLEAAVE